jgi:endoglucanase
MRKGLNLSHWFEYERGQAVSLDEMKLFHAMGLDHVRIPADPAVGGWQAEREAPPSFLGELRDAAAQAVQADLEVVVDLHLEPSDKKRIEGNPRLEAGLERLWSQMAAALVGLPREKLVFELFNEPQYYGLQRRRWPGLQRRLLAAVRAVAPQHLVLLSGSGGGSFEGLSGLAPAADANVGYVFHHYEPFLFTHQGASWLDERWTTAGLRRGLRYPPSAEVEGRAPLLRPHPQAAKELADCVNGGWDRGRLRAEIDRAGVWARAQGVRLFCNEFGVIRANVDEASRYRWLADVRGACEANGIGWTVWDCTDIFGLTAQSAQLDRVGRRTWDGPVVAALGLRGVGGGASR